MPYVNHLGLVANLQVPQNRGIIEIGHVRHIVNTLHLGRVDLKQPKIIAYFITCYSRYNLLAVVSLEGLGLPTDLDGGLVAVDLLDHTLVVATILLYDTYSILTKICFYHRFYDWFTLLGTQTDFLAS